MADRIAAAVLAVPGVVRLHPGPFGEASTYLPGRRVTGVKLGQDHVEVHVVLKGDEPIPVVAERIHTVITPILAAPAQLFVADLAVTLS